MVLHINPLPATLISLNSSVKDKIAQMLYFTQTLYL